MPNNVDFSKFDNISTVEVNPIGWVNPLHVEYTIAEDNVIFGQLTCFWRVRGTYHTFTIPMIRLDFLSSGNYTQHFENILENFREDYISWQEQGIQSEWVREYLHQFSKFIVI